METIIIGSNVQTIENEAFYVHAAENEDDYEYNLNLSSIINRTGRAFNWSGILLGESGTPSITGVVTYGTGTITITE